MKPRLAQLAEGARIQALLRRNAFVEPGVTDEQQLLLFEQLYCQNPAGKQYMVVADESGELVAFHATIPLQFRALGQELVGGLGSNLVVDEPYRKGLVFLQLQKFFFGQYQAHGLDLVYGLVTRPDVLKVHLKTGFKQVGVTPVYARPYKLEKLTARVASGGFAAALSPLLRGGNRLLRMGSSAPEGVLVEEASRFPAEVDELCDRLLARFPVCPLRTKKILDWRFTTLPHRGYRILTAYSDGKLSGYAVVRAMAMREFTTLAVVDLLADLDDTRAAKALLTRVHQLALELDVDLVSTIHTEESPLRPLFRSAGFLKTPESFTLVVNQPKGAAPALGPEQYRDWHVTWFDHDVV
jgi:hypothetical protein